MDITPAIRAELDQSPEWWDALYRALARKRIPRDAASHDGHNVIELRKYASFTVRRFCSDCGIETDPYQDQD